MRNYEFEDKISESKIQKIEKIIFEINKVIVIFGDLHSSKRKQLTIGEVMLLSIQPDDEESTDIMAYETLIGYDYEKKGNVYIHCLKTDTYEIVIKSYRPPNLMSLL